MGQTGFQDVKQDEINSGHLNLLKVQDNPFTGPMVVKVTSYNNKLHLTLNLFETCHPD